MPGQSETFRWYFPSGKSVMVRDLTCCTHADRSCIIAGFGGMTASMTFN